MREIIQFVSVDKHYIGPVGQFSKKIARLVGQLGSGPHIVGRIGSGVRVSASFQQMPASWVGTRLMADVVPADRVG